MRRWQLLLTLAVYALLATGFIFLSKLFRICRVKDNVSFLSAEYFKTLFPFTRHEN